jgi:hypothetical protein
MRLLHAVVAGLAPPLCASCGRHCRPEAIVCSRCARRLAGADPIAGNGPPGTDRAWSSAAHEDVARNLVTALKFRRLLPVAGLMADRVQWLAPADLLSGTIVPVPAAPRASWQRPLPSGPGCPSLRAWRGAARAASSAGAAPGGSATRPGSARRTRFPAAFCSSTTSSPPAPRSQLAPRPYALPAPFASPPSPSRDGCEVWGEVWGYPARARRPVFRTDHSAREAARKAKNPAPGRMHPRLPLRHRSTSSVDSPVAERAGSASIELKAKGGDRRCGSRFAAATSRSTTSCGST